MRNYDQFKLDDFLVDDFFCQWVLSPTDDHQEFWESWIDLHPGKKTLIQQAKSQVVQLKAISDTSVPKELLNESFDEIMNQTKVQTLPIKKRFNWYNRVAAAVAFLIIAGMLYFIEQDISILAFKDNNAQENWVTLKNEGNSVKRMVLEDGSILTLEPESQVKYPQEFESTNRTVFLEGEAFFEIATDSVKPFYVFANEAVVRVLGTSFLVKAKDEDKNIEVVVRTGKVAVYKRKEIQQAKQQKKVKAQPLLVTPNQKVVFEREAQLMTKRLTVAPTLIKPLDLQEKRKFEDAPVQEIFQALETAYGVEIMLASDAQTNCTLTTTLTNQTLFEKLDIICAPLGLKYHEKEARIIITGKCNQ